MRKSFAYAGLRQLNAAMFLRLLPVLAFALLSSCAMQKTCWSGGIPLRDSEAAAHSQAVRDFGKTADVKVYRGLAHPQAETELYQQQVAAGGWVEIEGFKFYRKPVPVSKATTDQVLELYARLDSHQAWGPKETCAGFHPDYVLVWTSGGRRRALQLCYGCHEWKFFGPGGMLLTDISEKAYFGPLTESWLPKAAP